MSIEVNSLTDIEFCELIRQVIDRLENEHCFTTVVRRSYNEAIIIIDNDDEVNEQIPKNPMKNWFDIELMVIANKEIKL